MPHPSRLCEGWDVHSPPAQLFFLENQKKRHFDRSHSHRELRSGEIRFSTLISRTTFSEPPNRHKKHATHHVSSTFFHPKNLRSAPFHQKKDPGNRDESPKKPATSHKPPQLTTKPEESFYPQPSGPSTSIDFAFRPKSISLFFGGSVGLLAQRQTTQSPWAFALREPI